MKQLWRHGHTSPATVPRAVDVLAGADAQATCPAGAMAPMSGVVSAPTRSSDASDADLCLEVLDFDFFDFVCTDLPRNSFITFDPGKNAK